MNAPALVTVTAFNRAHSPTCAFGVFLVLRGVSDLVFFGFIVSG
jgi:hypothetical protein